MHEFYNYTNKFLGMSKVGVKVYFEKKKKHKYFKNFMLEYIL